jgi:hypothetical protein
MAECSVVNKLRERHGIQHPGPSGEGGRAIEAASRRESVELRNDDVRASWSYREARDAMGASLRRRSQRARRDEGFGAFAAVAWLSTAAKSRKPATHFVKQAVRDQRSTRTSR